MAVVGSTVSDTASSSRSISLAEQVWEQKIGDGFLVLRGYFVVIIAPYTTAELDLPLSVGACRWAIIDGGDGRGRSGPRLRTLSTTIL